MLTRELERLLKARDEYEKRQLEIAERRRRRQGRKSDKTFPEHWKEPDKEVYEPVIKCTQIAAASPSGAAAASAIIPMAAPSAVAMQPPCSLAAQGQSALKAAAEAGQEMVSHLPSGEVPEVQAAAATRPSSSNGFSLGGQLRSTGSLRASVTSEKVSNILSFLEELEAQATEEAAAILPFHPLARTMAAQPSSLQSQQLAAAAQLDNNLAKAMDLASSSKLTSSSQEVLKGIFGDSETSQSPTAKRRHAREEVQHRREGFPHPQQPPVARVAAASIAVDSGSQIAGVINATSVADGVKSKIQRLQQQVLLKEQQLAHVAAEMQCAQQAQDQALQATLQQHQAVLQQQRAEHEATVARNLSFIDRILADKDALSAKCGQLSKEVASAQAECAKQMEALKEGLAKELRRQKEVWSAAERAKREAWVAEQTRSIKETTIKGLEPEIARLVETHKAEMKRADHRHELDCSRRLQAAAAQHEQHVAQLRQQWAGDKQAAVEAEKAAARDQVKDAQQRFEVELQGLRMRLAAEHEMQLDRAEAARREDKGRAEDRVAQLAREHEQRLAQARSEAGEERAVLARQHQRELDALKEKYETGQEAWRAAVAERAKQEVEQREAALRRQLAAERDAELRGVIVRLEEEYAGKEEAAQIAEREAASEARWTAELSRLRAAEAAAQERCCASEGRAAAAEEKIGRLEELVHTLQREVASKASSTAWLEEQLASTKREIAAREERVAEALADKEAEAATGQAALQQQLEALQGELEGAREQAQAAEQRCQDELAGVEARVKAALARKDTIIAGLREQLAHITTQLDEDE
ncbi:hypothetical protein N2152v2_000579 [Parachlorella kessleri]